MSEESTVKKVYDEKATVNVLDAEKSMLPTMDIKLRVKDDDGAVSYVDALLDTGASGIFANRSF